MTATGVVVIAGAYLLGSVPFGWLIGRWRGVDVRRTGSGNIGATNVMRSTGRALGAVTFLLDSGKGAVGPLVALSAGQGMRVVALAGLAGIVGHCFSVFMRFRGGKGVATFVGAQAVLDPLSALAGALGFAGSLLTTGYVAVSSMVLVLLALAMTAWRHGPTDPRVAMCAVALILLAVRHKGNWSRMMGGGEGKLLGKEEGA